MSDTTQRILRVRRTDALDAVPPFALLNIGLVKGSQKSLDIKIIATEGTASFVATGKSCNKTEIDYQMITIFGFAQARFRNEVRACLACLSICLLSDFKEYIANLNGHVNSRE